MGWMSSVVPTLTLFPWTRAPPPPRRPNSAWPRVSSTVDPYAAGVVAAATAVRRRCRWSWPRRGFRPRPRGRVARARQRTASRRHSPGASSDPPPPLRRLGAANLGLASRAPKKSASGYRSRRPAADSPTESERSASSRTTTSACSSCPRFWKCRGTPKLNPSWWAAPDCSAGRSPTGGRRSGRGVDMYIHPRLSPDAGPASASGRSPSVPPWREIRL